MLKLRENRSILQKSIIFFFIFVFIVAFLLFLTQIYIKPLNYFDRMPFLLYIGFAIIIVVFFSFMIFELDNENKILFKFRFLSENSIKIILMIIMSITIFIPPISFTTTVVDWNQVGILNYFRAISFLIGCLFLPGANLFKIFFPKNTLHERFKVEPFIIKITLYPLLSLIFLGTSVLILDQIGFLRDSITIILFLLILGLFFSDLIIQKMRNGNIDEKIVEITISKYTLIILVVALGILLISLGIQINAKYLVGSDSWIGISPAKYIGSLDPSPVERKYDYLLFWGYNSFALSALCGFPYININAMLAPFCYLSITSVYLFIKAILYNFKEKYIILSTILGVTFSSLFYTSGLGLENTSPLIQDFVFFFRYKSYSYFLLFSSLALFFIIFNTNKIIKTKQMLKTEDFKILILGALFLIHSYMIYLLPFMAGLYLILLYCLFSEKIKKKIQIFFLFIFLIFLFLILFDLLTYFYLSNIFLIELNKFFRFFPNLLDIPKNIRAFLIYSVLGGVFIFYIILQRLYDKYFHIKKKSQYRKNFLWIKVSELKKRLRIKTSAKNIFIFILTIFSIFLIIEIYNIILEKIFLDYNLSNKDFLIFYIELIFTNIGFIGILAVNLSYFCFKKNKKLFYVLISWILFSLGLASILIFKLFFLDYPFAIPQEIPGYDYLLMTYWFDRIWFYSIPAFSIMASIGLIKLTKKLKNSRLLIKRKKLRHIFDFSSVSIFIVLSFSSFILGGMYWACSYKSGFGGYSDSEAQVVGWISEHIPRRSNISIDCSFLSRSSDKKRMLEYMTDCNAYYINKIIETALQEKDCWDWEFINESDFNCKIGIIDELDGHCNVLKCEDQNKTGSIKFQFKFDSAQKYGTINFYIRTMDVSNFFCIEYLDYSSLKNPIILNISSAIYSYNGNKYQKIIDIQNNTWYHIRIDFECSIGGYNGLNQYKWNFFIDDIKYGDFIFWNNVSQIDGMRFLSSTICSGWDFYFDAFNFSWEPDFNVENCIFLGPTVINYLERENIRYLILSEEETLFNSEAGKINIQDDLISKFFNTKLYEYQGFSVYYAPI